MNTLLKIITASLFIFNVPFIAKAQDANNISDNIAKAFKVGNAKDLASYFHTNIELIVLEKDGTYSKAQAEIIMKDFFTKNPPKEFSINHNGSSKDSSAFYIGSYKTASNNNYRIYFLIKSISGKFLIQQLQIQD